jgi:hypothetical protein
VLVVPTSALTSGKVTLAPDSLAEAPTIPSSLAFVPRVTVLVQPAPKSTITAAVATSVFIYVFLSKTPTTSQGPRIILRPYPRSSVIYYVNQIVISGLNVDILKNRVKIYDVAGDLSKPEAVLIIKYLHSEGFLKKGQDQIILEIVSGDEI